MITKISPACLTPNWSYKILGDLCVDVFIHDNPYCIGIDSLFEMAARKNKKRCFLFVSKVLGKHIPVHPLIPFIGGAALAQRYAEVLYGAAHHDAKREIVQALANPEKLHDVWRNPPDKQFVLPEPTLFIGFAETATALGHAMFRRFGGKAIYFHTTRENIFDFPNALEFVEEHSHAPDHVCYIPDPKIFANNHRVVLIDDEITTGKSALNFIKIIQNRYPRKRYIVISLLDWRSAEDRGCFAATEEELGIEIKTISLVTGQIAVRGSLNTFHCDGQADQQHSTGSMKVEKLYLEEFSGHKIGLVSVDGYGKINCCPYLQGTGRFGLSLEQNREYELLLSAAGRFLREKRRGKKTLCLGTGEFMYIPFLLSLHMGDGVVVQSTTRSPIHPADRKEYAVKCAVSFSCPGEPSITNYIYNLPPGFYDEIFVFFERDVAMEQLEPMLAAFRSLQLPRVCVVVCARTKNIPYVKSPEPIGSYSRDDVVFLLKNIGCMLAEQCTDEREAAIQSGGHYSEMLPVEYRPAEDYMELFYQTLRETASKVALAVGIVAEKILKLRGTRIVLVSLARAGTPIGILIKRYLKTQHALDLPHYSISIIRNKGIDENALLYIFQQHPLRTIQFVDGWTGKGVIAKELIQACKAFSRKYGVGIDSDMAVLADPGNCVRLYGTREDFLIPSACLNATVSGLISRTVHRIDLVGPNDFHGAKYYNEWEKDDVSGLFIDTVSQYFSEVQREAATQAEQSNFYLAQPTWEGWEKVKEIQESFGLGDINLVKPGVGETTRVLLRRVPWRVLVNSKNNPSLRHIFLLTAERGVHIEEWMDLPYSCCGLIKPRGR